MVNERTGFYGPGELALVELRTRFAPLTRAIAWEVDRRVAAAREREGEPGPLVSIAVTEQHAVGFARHRDGIHPGRSAVRSRVSRSRTRSKTSSRDWHGTQTERE